MTLTKGHKGSIFSDERGKLLFFNTFDMTEIVRFYNISPSSPTIIRAWQGHMNEKKWLYCQQGEFNVNLIKIDDFNKPSDNLIPESFILNAKEPYILEVPGGYASGFKSTVKDSKLMVYSNFSVKASQEDDFRYPLEKWSVNW